MSPSTCHADQEGRAVPTSQASRQRLGLPVQQGTLQVSQTQTILITARGSADILTFSLLQVNILYIQQALQWRRRSVQKNEVL